MRIPKRIGIWQESRFESVIQFYEFELPLNQKQNQSMNQDRVPMTVGILIFDQVEVLGVTGPFEVFSVTRLSEERRQEESSPFRVLLVAEKIDQVLAIGGLRLTPDVTFENCPKLDLLIVPGGWGTRKEVKNVNLLNWIANRAANTRLTASVCTGAGLLGQAGLLDGREATTHWRTFDFLRDAAPNAKIRKDVLFTLVEPIFTSAGISAGIDLALRIVSYFFGTKIGRATARQMEYPYPQNDRRRSNI
jgi:transcriptional regulator GlxA family with amidase domain